MPGLVPSMVCSMLIGFPSAFPALPPSFTVLTALGQETASKQTSIPSKPAQWLIMPAGARGGRTPIRTDLLERQLVLGPWKTPKNGDHLEGDEKKKWQAVDAAEDGSIRHPGLAGGYALWTFESPKSELMILEAKGHGMVYVNGSPRPGDPYGYGFLGLPVAIRKGVNEFLFFGGRGAISASLRKPKGAIELSTDDATLPDLVAKTPGKYWGAVVVRNASDTPLGGLTIKSSIAGKETVSSCPTILPLGIYKVPFEFAIDSLAKGETKLQVSAQLTSTTAATHSYPLAVKDEAATRKVTFLSRLDGSVQYYGLVPALAGKESAAMIPAKKDPIDKEPPAEKPGLVLSLHGASVEAFGQAACYAPKTWAHVVAPTNRRPYGFDWEDWGRMDAIEVLDLGQKSLGTDPAKTWLTGHSMGGHGTWHLGVTYPDRFAAVAPSAGWVSMFSYAGARKPETKTAIGRMLARATNPGDTVGLITNLATRGVFILHGDADDNVPVSQARSMRLQLASFHPDLAYYEKKGAGHWWGNECVDWPALMRFLQDRKRPDPLIASEIEFKTFHPGISSKMAWLELCSQKEWGELSEVKFKRDLIRGTISGTTKNADRIRLFAMGWPTDAKIRWMIDGQEGETERWNASGALDFEYRDKKWTLAEKPEMTAIKTPQAAGPLKEAFSRRFAIIVGTSGTPDETQANLDKARFDQETFYYRGNGAIEVITDLEYERNAERFRGRNLVLVGNRDNNKSWKALAEPGPIQMAHGQIDLPEGKRLEGEELAAVIVRPKKGEPDGQIVLMGATGPKGMKLLQRLSLWVSGSSFPDFLIMEPSLLKEGMPGIIGAGYFDSHWQWDAHQSALR